MKKDLTQTPPDIYNYIDFRKFLKEYYEYHKKTTGFFSYRYFSNKAGFSSHNVLKLVINGQRNIALKSIDKFSFALNLNSRESDYFRLIVLFGQVRDEQKKNTLFQELTRYRQGSRVQRMSELQYKMYSEWYNAVIRELITLKDFREDPEWSAGKLSPNITPGRAKRSLKLLQELGLISRDSDGKLVQEDPVIKTPEEVSSLSIRNYNRKMIDLAREAIEKVDHERREISGITAGISERSFKKIREKIRKFKDEILDDISSDLSDSDRVYQVNFQFFPLLCEDTGGNRSRD